MFTWKGQICNHKVSSGLCQVAFHKPVSFSRKPGLRKTLTLFTSVSYLLLECVVCAGLQIEAEIQLSMYEALASLFKALALSVSPHVLSIVNESVIFGGAHDGKAMDMLVWNLLEHVNRLLHGRILARSRRAVLLLQKVVPNLIS